MMNYENKLLDICAEVLDIDRDNLSLDTERNTIENFDSLAILQIVDEMCNLFGINVSEDALVNERIVKISDFLKLISK